MTIKEQVDTLWKELHEYGIYTEEQLDKALKETPLNIGIFVSPIPGITREEVSACGQEPEKS